MERRTDAGQRRSWSYHLAVSSGRRPLCRLLYPSGMSASNVVVNLQTKLWTNPKRQGTTNMERRWPSSYWNKLCSNDRAGWTAKVGYSGCWIQYGTYQEAISQPVVQDEHNGCNKTDSFGVNEALVPNRPRGEHAINAREFAAINVGD